MAVKKQGNMDSLWDPLGWKGEQMDQMDRLTALEWSPSPEFTGVTK